jgi:hypothetical protein
MTANRMKSSCLVVGIASLGTASWGEVTPLPVVPTEISQPETFINSVTMLMGLEPAGPSQPRGISQAPVGRYHLPSGLLGPGPVNGVDLCSLPKPLNLAEEAHGPCDGNQYYYLYLRFNDRAGVQPDFFAEGAYLEYLADERLWELQTQLQLAAFRPPPVIILPSPPGNPNLDIPPRVPLDTLDLSPGAQVDLRTVPADMLPRR